MWAAITYRDNVRLATLREPTMRRVLAENIYSSSESSEEDEADPPGPLMVDLGGYDLGSESDELL
jgi:hypothetical protein